MQVQTIFVRRRQEEIIDNLFRAKHVIHMNHPECKVIFLSLITRTDYQTLTEKLIDFNEHFFDICKSKKYDIIDNRSGNYGHGLQMEMHQIIESKCFYALIGSSHAQSFHWTFPILHKCVFWSKELCICRSSGLEFLF